MIADNEEYRVVYATNSQHSAANSADSGSSGANTHNTVATALPPYNFKKTGYMWAKNTATAAHAANIDAAPSSVPMMRAMTTASTPLRTSPKRVIPAAILLPLRSTLVAPGFLEPNWRGSGNRINLLITTAKGIEPIK